MNRVQYYSNTAHPVIGEGLTFYSTLLTQL